MARMRTRSQQEQEPLQHPRHKMVYVYTSSITPQLHLAKVSNQVQYEYVIAGTRLNTTQLEHYRLAVC